jgi:hypothetical protein
MNALLEHVWGKSAAQDRVWAQVVGLAPGKASGRLLMALNYQAFIDESLSHDDLSKDGELVLAGHIATAEKWGDFSQAWEPLLAYGTRAKNGKLHFKMSEMASNPQRMERVPLFSKVIDDHIDLSISCRMNLLDFAEAHKRFESFASVMQWTVNWGPYPNPYYFVFWVLLKGFHQHRHQFEEVFPANEKVDFYFDNRSEKSSILGAWDEVMNKLDPEEREKYSTAPRFEDDQEFLPLQAADFWAWWVREWYEEDSSEVPTKMRNFDFGSWKGKKRRAIAVSLSEDNIFEDMQAMAVEMFAEGVHFTPGFRLF